MIFKYLNIYIYIYKYLNISTARFIFPETRIPLSLDLPVLPRFEILEEISPPDWWGGLAHLSSLEYGRGGDGPGAGAHPGHEEVGFVLNICLFLTVSAAECGA